MLEDSKDYQSLLILRAVTATQQLSVSHELMVKPAMHRRRKTSPKEAPSAAQCEEGAATQHRNHREDEDGLKTKVSKRSEMLCLQRDQFPSSFEMFSLDECKDMKLKSTTYPNYAGKVSKWLVDDKACRMRSRCFRRFAAVKVSSPS